MKTIVFAHRGASKLAPENTMPAFELAYQMGADGIETDVQLTKDKVPVLIHDENVRRTTNGTGFVQDYTFDQLQKLDAGSWFSTRFANTSIVSLEQFLQWAQNKNLRLNIELKNNIIDYKNLEEKVYSLLSKYNVIGNTVISSFSPNSIKKLNKIDQNLSTAFLTSTKIKGLVDYTKSLGASALHLKYRSLTNSLVEACHNNDLDIRIYTVNRPISMMRCYKLKCDAIFTDVPHTAIEYWELYKHKHTNNR
ncbi:glycerophosphodiester phosphodiesterase [Aquibacillus halophilus]|uniref:Glycerophosphodiester phosphodiesterase n=1 Tax=Aquibacillus halophilus TaxID=930132 RepID=A0A6A8D9Q9_9BACI|nr:glycerophosphodiester phosphodiesterase [Aquibacillus halophilus]MRH42318.1 glycerophosphodiester phosphodiesterase [Aquibacillus halophilus]